MAELFGENSPVREESEGIEGQAERTEPVPHKKKLAIVGGVLLVVVLLVAGGVWYYVTPNSADSPEEAVKLYIQALDDGDKEQFKEVVCKQDRERIDSGTDRSSILGKGASVTDVNYDVKGKKKVNDDTYRVHYSVKASIEYDGQSQKIDTDGAYVVVKEEGDWRVCESKRI